VAANINGGFGTDTITYALDTRSLSIRLDTQQTFLIVPPSGVDVDSDTPSGTTPPDTFASPENLMLDSGGQSPFTLAENANILDATTSPHVTVSGTGNDSFDYYSFTVTAADLATFGTVSVIIDIDGGYPPYSGAPGSMDT